MGNLKQSDINRIVNKVLRESEDEIDSYEEEVSIKPKKSSREIKLDYMVDRFSDKFEEIGLQYGEDFAFDLLDRLKDTVKERMLR